MKNKKIMLSVTILCAIGLAAFYMIHKPGTMSTSENNFITNTTQKEEKSAKNTNLSNKADTTKTNDKVKAEKINTNIIEQNDDKIIHTNLYSDSQSTEIPLSAIAEISDLPQSIQDTVADISKTNNIYMIQRKKDKLLLITDNSDNIRHRIEFTEISIHNGHKIKTTLGYNDTVKDTQNDIWEYDTETSQPTRHTKYNSDGDMDFVEVWNYDVNEPVKYEMKDSKGKVISMRKETLNNGTDLRVEHLLYDKSGNTTINVSATYDGEDIKRFTYYNAEKPNESGSIFSDYSDGLKTKETVYTSDLKVKNTYTSDYKDGTRKDIIKYDNQNQEVKKYLPVENL